MFVYVIICNKSLKLYIGQHKKDDLGKYLSQKFYDANRYSGKRSHLYSAMRKYPRDSWSIHPLISGIETKAELDEAERLLIYALKAQHPDVGYNICDGGEGFTGPHSEDAKRKIREDHIKNREVYRQISLGNKRALGCKHSPAAIACTLGGKNFSPAWRQKQSDAHKGQVTWQNGLKFSDEHKQHLSESHKGQIPWNKGKKFGGTS